MTEIRQKCIVCNTEKTISHSIVCDSCGWIYLFFLNQPSQKVNSFLNKKVNLKQSFLEGLRHKTGEEKQLLEKLQMLKNALTIQRTETDRKIEELRGIEEKIKDLDKKINRFDRPKIETKITQSEQLLQQFKPYKNIPVNYLELTEIYWKRENNNLIFSKTDFTLPDIVLGFSNASDFLFIEEADVILKVNQERQRKGLNFEFQIPAGLQTYKYFKPRLLKKTDTLKFKLIESVV